MTPSLDDIRQETEAARREAEQLRAQLLQHAEGLECWGGMVRDHGDWDLAEAILHQAKRARQSAATKFPWE